MTTSDRAESGPRVQVTQIGGALEAGTGRWSFSWLVSNESDQPLQITAAWLPHGRFRTEPQDYEPALVLAPGGRTTLTFGVAVDAEGGPVIENGFILLRTRWRDAPWRIFVRLRVTLDPGGPVPVTESLETQPIGFEG